VLKRIAYDCCYSRFLLDNSDRLPYIDELVLLFMMPPLGV